MREIECVRLNEDQDNYLKKLFKEAGLNPILVSWEDARVSNSKALVLMIDDDHIEAVEEICNNRDLKIIVGLNTRREFKIISKLKSCMGDIFGFIDISQELDYNIPLLNNYINTNFSKNAISSNELANKLDKIYEHTKTELTRVKDLHDRLVRIRVDALKGISITSKFMSGEKSGGEFFDVIQSGYNVLYVQAGSNDYMLSSLIISELESLKFPSTPISNADLKFHGEKFEREINRHAKGRGASLNYIIINIDLLNLKADFVFEGNSGVYFPSDEIIFSRSFKTELKELDKFYLVSEGTIKNLNELNSSLQIDKFFKEHLELSTRDLVNELFFELSRNKAGNFLNYDAIMSVFEVEKKTLYHL